MHYFSHCICVVVSDESGPGLESSLGMTKYIRNAWFRDTLQLMSAFVVFPVRLINLFHVTKD